jgi:hypothetical protein
MGGVSAITDKDTAATSTATGSLDDGDKESASPRPDRIAINMGGRVDYALQVCACVCVCVFVFVCVCVCALCHLPVRMCVRRPTRSRLFCRKTGGNRRAVERVSFGHLEPLQLLRLQGRGGVVGPLDTWPGHSGVEVGGCVRVRVYECIHINVCKRLTRVHLSSQHRLSCGCFEGEWGLGIQ